eukprot:3433237-Amphidinium_carterae.1
MALEVNRKHGKRLNPRWDYEAYHADVMAARGDCFVDRHQAQAAPSPQQGNPEESMKDSFGGSTPVRVGQKSAGQRCALRITASNPPKR